MKIKYYELNCGVKATEEEIKNGAENGCEINVAKLFPSVR